MVAGWGGRSSPAHEVTMSTPDPAVPDAATTRDGKPTTKRLVIAALLFV